MTDSPPPSAFPSAFARLTRAECGGSGREADVPSRPIIGHSPPTDQPSTSTPPPIRRGFPSTLTRPVPIAVPTPSPPPSSLSERRPSPAAAAQAEEEAEVAAPVTPPPPRRRILCPYPSDEGERHEVPFGEFHLHIIGCRTKHFTHPDLVQMTRCRYNGTHYIPAPELAMHERLCRDERRTQIEEQIKTDPIPVVVFEGSSDSDSSESDDDGYEIVDMPEKERGEQKKEEDRKEEDVVGEEEYGRVVHDLIQI